MQLSDLHVGPRVDDDYVTGVFDRVRALAPDIVAFTGDFTENDAGCRARARVYRAPRSDASRRSASSATTTTGRAGASGRSRDRSARCSPSAGSACCATRWSTSAASTIVGLDDLWAKRFQPAAALDPRRGEAGARPEPQSGHGGRCRAGSDYEGWILRGHTHGGQCKPPFLPPPLIPVRNRRYTSGEIDATGGRRLYISRGVGHMLTVRFNVRPEVTVFTLQRA